MNPIMTETEYETAWIKANYEVLGWWIPPVYNDWEWVQIPDPGKLIENAG